MPVCVFIGLQLPRLGSFGTGNIPRGSDLKMGRLASKVILDYARFQTSPSEAILGYRQFKTKNKLIRLIFELAIPQNHLAWTRLESVIVQNHLACKPTHFQIRTSWNVAISKRTQTR